MLACTRLSTADVAHRPVKPRLDIVEPPPRPPTPQPPPLAPIFLQAPCTWTALAAALLSCLQDHHCCGTAALEILILDEATPPQTARGSSEDAEASEKADAEEGHEAMADDPAEAQAVVDAAAAEAGTGLSMTSS